MDIFENGKVFGVDDLEGSESEMVFKTEPKRVRKNPKMPKGCNYPGKIITINRDCSQCAREIKLQVGSDLVFLDGRPYLLPIEIQLLSGEILIPLNFFIFTVLTLNNQRSSR